MSVTPRLWLVFGNPSKYASLLEEFPVLKPLSIYYKYILKPPEDVLEDGRLLVQLGIESGVCKLELLRSKIQNIVRIKLGVEKVLKCQPSLDEGQAREVLRS